VYTFDIVILHRHLRYVEESFKTINCIGFYIKYKPIYKPLPVSFPSTHATEDSSIHTSICYEIPVNIQARKNGKEDIPIILS